MKIKELQLTNFRGLTDTKITFNPGFNLIVGENGAGKSSVLDAIRTIMNQIWPKLYGKNTLKPNLGFNINDIQIDKKNLGLEMTFDLDRGEIYKYNVVKHRETYIPDKSNKSNEDSIYKKQGSVLSDKADLQDFDGNIIDSVKVTFEESRPIFLFLSVDRAKSFYETTRISKNIHTAYSNAFNSNRGMNIQELASWWAAKEILGKEKPESLNIRHLSIVSSVLHKLLPGFFDWSFEQSDGEKLTNKFDLVMKKKYQAKKIDSLTGDTIFYEENKKLFAWQLSDGERSIISIVFDISRRLILLNPKEENPIQNGQGIVLIDEIDLHLHPRWQREITKKLPELFPNIQFICTTHSPQVIGETEPGHVVSISETGEALIQSESLGRESGWILRHIMGSVKRTERFRVKLDEIEKLIDDDKFSRARKLNESLREKYGNDPEIVKIDIIIDRLEYENWDEDEEDY